MQHSRAQVEHPVVVADLAVAQVEGLVVDQQPDQLAVSDIEDGLSGLRESVAGFGVGQPPILEERAEVGAGQPARVALVEIAARPDVPVGQREQRFGARQVIKIEAHLAELPRVDRKPATRGHSSCARSSTTIDAPWSSSPWAWAASRRLIPTT